MSDPSISSISLRSAGQKRRLNYNDNHVAPHLKQIYKKKKKDTDKPYFCKTSILKEGEVVERPINDPEQIVFWRWKKTSSKKRVLFIKWKKLSYWKCTWVPEKVIEYHFPQLHTFYFRDNDSEVPPDLEESPNRHHHADNDPYDLHERFYQFGVKPEWLQIHRIMSHDACENDEFDYLVKWREVPHSKATWERDDADIANYEEAIMKYWIHREKNTNEKPPDKIQNMIAQHLKRLGLSLKSEKLRIPKADLQIKYETQPGYIFESVGTLHPYQLEGISWLRNCYSNGTDAILADEMGLGKTIQALTFLYSLMKEGHCEGPFLIVAPLSTILNWEREAEKWCPDFYVVTYVGDQDSRMVLRDYEFSYTPAAIRHGKGVAKMRNVKRKFDVVLTSYEIVNMDKCLLSSIAWDALVVDEAHRLKNDDALLFKTLNKYTIDYRVLLTGTPLQNNLKELFHLLNFLSPDRFDQLEEFLEEFSDISKEEQIEKLHNLLEPHMLRRLKADVFTGIPPKTELIVRVELSALQKEMYKNIFTKNVAALASTTGIKFTAMQHMYMQLRKCCNHPYIFDTASLEAPKDEAGNYEGTALIKNAGKFVLLQKMLRKLKAQGHRVLIFSQMTKLLDILEDFCDYEGYEYERIDGSITGQMRQDAIDRYNAPGAQQFVFLLSTRAGGLGINLATADTVIIYDSDWNPHNDIQALSRAHRIGQTKKVMIYRYVTKGSVEEQMIAAAKRKMLLNHLVVETGVGGREGKNGGGMSKTELEEALKWGAEKLFKEDEEDGEGRRKKKSAMVWTDDAIDSLLNRDREEEPAREGKSDRQEYMSSFKVADYNPKNAMEDDEDDDDDDERPDPNYWQNMLKARMENLKKEEEPEEENGKRIRKQINYDEDVEDDWDVKDETENQDASSHDSGSN